MYSKIPLRNVKRSFKDYAIYFLTLTFAVCIFYSFNSISSQQAMLEISSSKKDIMMMLTDLIGGASIFVSIVLGFLIIYANNFLIKRRKKEIGLYMSLGMSKRKISSILINETLIIGFISLIAGLIVGVIVSQGLSLFTSKLFDINVSKYNFVFSGDATLKTILYFGIIFILVMLFNTVTISKYQLIDLLTAGRKNETLKIKSTKISLGMFVVSLIAIGTAYIIILKNGLMDGMIPVQISVVLGIVGTFMFFMSLSGFLIGILQKNPRFYLKDLNMFVLRQINSKVNTTYISMAIISLMLFLTITLLASGVSFKDAMQSELEASTPFDVTFFSYQNEENTIDIEQSLSNAGFDIKDKFESYNKITVYDSKAREKEYIYNYADKDIKKNLEDYNAEIRAISITDFNNSRKMKGEEELKLQENETIIISNVNGYYQAVNEFIENNKNIKIGDKTYNILNKKALEENIKTEQMTSESFTIIVPDEDVKNMEVSSQILNASFKENSETLENEIYETLNGFKKGKYDYEVSGFVLGQTRLQAYDMSSGMTTTILYIGIYLGIIFLISSAAVLALQQLSEASDNIERYKVLKKIGVSSKLVNRAVFSQIMIYFMMPLTLATIHAVVGIAVANQTIQMFGQSNIFIPSIITAIIIGIIYGGYFIATYLGYKNIIKSK